MAVVQPPALRDWPCAREPGSDAQSRVVGCHDTLELILARLTDKKGLQQCSVVPLFLVSRLFQEAAKGLDIWTQLEWEAASRGARHSDAALPALRLSIERWWGSRLKSFDAGSGCPTFRELLTDDTLALIARSAPRLQAVRLWGCSHITNNGLKRLAAAAPPLRSFSLEWCGGGVCLEGLRAVVRACPALEAFSISCGQSAAGQLGSVGDGFAAELAAACPNLAALELSDSSVGDAGLEAIAAAYGPHLTALVLNYTKRWGRRGAAALAEGCPRLQVFSAAASAGPDDDALAALGARCAELAYVCVDRCPGVTLDGVIRLVNRSTAQHGHSTASTTAGSRDGGGRGALRYVAMAGIHRQSAPEQRAFFARWVAMRGLCYDSRAGLLELS